MSLLITSRSLLEHHRVFGSRTCVSGGSSTTEHKQIYTLFEHSSGVSTIFGSVQGLSEIVAIVVVSTLCDTHRRAQCFEVAYQLMATLVERE